MTTPATQTKTLLGAAHGRTGRMILGALVRRGVAVRALIRREVQSQALLDLGARECAVGDLQDRATLLPAASGCDTAIYIGPPMHPDEVGMAMSFYEAARAAGVAHFVYYSVLHPVCRDIRHHRLKLEVEEQIVDGPLPFTILQPARYMQHLEPLLPQLREAGVHAMPFSIDVKFNVVDLADVAEAVAEAVTSPRWRFGSYELAGPEALSQRDMAATLSQLLGRRIEAQALPLEVMRERAARAGASADRVEQMSIMNGHYDRHGMLGNPLVLQLLLGRPPTTFAQYAARVLGAGPRA
jgi:uncharacterized protein YbjT (DUF2867 family)